MANNIVEITAETKLVELNQDYENAQAVGDDTYSLWGEICKYSKLPETQVVEYRILTADGYWSFETREEAADHMTQ